MINPVQQVCMTGLRRKEERGQLGARYQMSTTETFHARIPITTVKLQMFGGETCRVHGKVDSGGHGNSR